MSAYHWCWTPHNGCLRCNRVPSNFGVTIFRVTRSRQTRVWAQIELWVRDQVVWVLETVWVETFIRWLTRSRLNDLSCTRLRTQDVINRLTEHLATPQTAVSSNQVISELPSNHTTPHRTLVPFNSLLSSFTNVHNGTIHATISIHPSFFLSINPITNVISSKVGTSIIRIRDSDLSPHARH